MHLRLNVQKHSRVISPDLLHLWWASRDLDAGTIHLVRIIFAKLVLAYTFF